MFFPGRAIKLKKSPEFWLHQSIKFQFDVARDAFLNDVGDAHASIIVSLQRFAPKEGFEKPRNIIKSPAVFVRSLKFIMDKSADAMWPGRESESTMGARGVFPTSSRR